MGIVWKPDQCTKPEKTGVVKQGGAEEGETVPEEQMGFWENIASQTITKTDVEWDGGDQ